MEFKSGDIVKIISKNEECMVMTDALDLDNNKTKYVVYSSNGKSIYIVSSDDMLFIDNLENELKEKLEDMSCGQA